MTLKNIKPKARGLWLHVKSLQINCRIKAKMPKYKLKKKKEHLLNSCIMV